MDEDERIYGECVSCGEYFGDADVEYCKKSRRKCGHHCGHVWSTHQVCHWCGFDASPIRLGKEE